MGPPAQDTLARSLPDNPAHHHNTGNAHNNNNPITASADEDLDPATFLKSVRELSEKREREDAERYRRLEEEVEKSRAERAARRAERARSLSPEKMAAVVSGLNPSPALSPSPSLAPSRTTSLALEPAVVHAQPPSPTKDIPEFSGFGSIKKKDNPVMASKSADLPRASTPPSASSLARSGTLSWQRRPNSTIVSQRPMSMLAPTSKPIIPKHEPSGATSMNREDIAASLASRDPSWFKQTAERGVGNAALNKSRDDAISNRSSMNERRILPGMARDSSLSLARSTSPTMSQSQKSETSRPSSMRDSTYSSRFSVNSTVSSAPSKPDLNALISADAEQERASPMSDKTTPSEMNDAMPALRTPTMSSSQARLTQAPERPLSPTKGMGGFVQSAMMKRSDSVSKRWSAQPGSTSLSRQNSVASASNGLQASQSMPKLDPKEQIKDTSAELGSASEHAKEILNMGRRPTGHSHHARNKSFTSLHGSRAEDSIASPPASPSKRWSPTKASWIESALNKPETPRPSTPKNTQPGWMADIARAKAQRASVEVSSTPALAQLPEKPTWMSSSPGKIAMSGSSNRIDGAEPQPLAHPPSHAISPPAKPKPIGLGLDRVPFPSSQNHIALPDINEPLTQSSDQREVKPEHQPQQSPISDSTSEHLSDAHSSPSVFQAMRPTLNSPLKPKPDVSPKPVTDFRSALRTRPPAEPKKEETPEFLSKFGNLRRAQTEKYTAPDVLKDNITRGKADLVKTGGPVKTPRRDELKEILLAKKDDIKKAKEDGRALPGDAHQRKTADVPVVAAKPEALVKKDTLSRVVTTKSEPSLPLRPRESNPEPLSLHKTLSAKPPAQADEIQADSKPTAASDTSKIAAKFNPGLASLLARGPPPSTGFRAQNSGITSAQADRKLVQSGGIPDSDAPLQDMRKGRAKGPKKRKQSAHPDSVASQSTMSQPEPLARPNPSSPFASRPAQRNLPSVIRTPSKPDSLKDLPAPQTNDSRPTDVADFKGFRSSQTNGQRGGTAADDDKENAGSVSVVKSAASRWARAEATPSTPAKSMSLPIPSKKDEDAAMRSAGLLASSPIRSLPGTPTDAKASAALPPKPAKSSRIVSGQLQEANPNKGMGASTPTPETAIERRLAELAGTWPVHIQPLTIDVQAVISDSQIDSPDDVSSFKRSVYELSAEAGLLALPQTEECILFDHSVYLCHHLSATKKGQIFIWSGRSSSQLDDGIIQDGVRALVREKGASTTSRVAQGHESLAFLKMFGGILITRRGSRLCASKQYMLRGRKHLESFVFDEVDCDKASLCSGFVYLVSYPITLQQINMYLWKGSASSMEEISAARLAAMELSESGDIIEVDDGAEFASFLKLFGPGTNKNKLPARRAFWEHKARNPNDFAAHLFRIQQAETKGGFISSLWRRPSWNSLSPVRSPARSPSRPVEDVKAEARHIHPFTQQDLDAEGVYVLDAYCEIYVIVGPLFNSFADPRIRGSLLVQAMRFALEYSSSVGSSDGRPQAPQAFVVLSGTPPECAFLFRHWDVEHDLWGTSSLMAGSQSRSHAMFHSMAISVPCGPPPIVDELMTVWLHDTAKRHRMHARMRGMYVSNIHPPTVLCRPAASPRQIAACAQLLTSVVLCSRALMAVGDRLLWLNGGPFLAIRNPNEHPTCELEATGYRSSFQVALGRPNPSKAMRKATATTLFAAVFVATACAGCIIPQNNRTAPFAVDGTKIPEVSFDIGESYAGLLPVSSKADASELFFWFFPSENPSASDEILIWLNGGPGCSSLEGLLQENGPFLWQPGTFGPVKNPWSWTNLTNVVWIEQPAGTGFSQQKKGSTVPTNELEVATQFLGFFKNFVDTFSLHGRKVFITGESYAGQYIPYIADAMHQAKNKEYYNINSILMNDPTLGNYQVQTEIPIAPYARQWAGLFGLNNTYLDFLDQQAESCQYTAFMEEALTYPPKGPFPTPPDNCHLYDDVQQRVVTFNPCFNPYHITDGCPVLWDVLGEPGAFTYTPPGAQVYFARRDVQDAIHAPHIDWAGCADNVLVQDTSPPTALSVLPRVIEQNTRTLINHGALDFIFLINGTFMTVQNMTWHSAQGFSTPPSKWRSLVVPPNDFQGVSQLAGSGVFGIWHEERGLLVSTVQFAGHMIPQYAPSVAYQHVKYLLGRIDALD